MSTPYPRVGVGVILVNHQGQVLLGKRKGSHAPYWSIAGGHLELGESFESAAIREVAEETGFLITNPSVIAVTNNLETWRESGLHYISVTLLAEVEGEPQLLEPEKCEGWVWCDPRALPEPHFDASRQSISCWLAGRCYLPQPGRPFLSPSPAGWPDAAICRSRASRSNPHPLLVERALLHASGNPIR